MKSTNYVRIRPLEKLRSHTFSEAINQKSQKIQPKISRNLYNILEQRKHNFRSEIVQMSTKKMKTASSYLQSEVKSDQDKKYSRSLCVEFFKNQQFVINLCKKFETNKFKIRQSICKIEQPMFIEDNQTQKECRWKKIRTKLLTKKYTIQQELFLNDATIEHSKSSKREMLKLRMKQLQGDEESHKSDQPFFQ